MKTRIQYIIFCLFTIFVSAYPSAGMSQEAVNPYFIEGDDVVFVFDVRNYANALRGPNADKLDFKDLNVYDVAVTGQFNNWSREAWKMTKKTEFIFELRKRLEDFNDPFPLEFKYIINGKFITDPAGTKPNSRQFTDDFLEDVYKLDLSVIKITKQGNTLFALKDHLNAGEVILAGSFNGWDEHALKMNKGSDGWYLQADLPPGRYEYKFIVDKEWLHDPACNETVVNEHGTLNSVMYVTQLITFKLEGFTNSKKVILTGSFVDWDENKYKMKFENGSWMMSLPIPGGKHHYKFIVDGQWHTDPSNPIIEDDGYGNLNSVLFVH